MTNKEAILILQDELNHVKSHLQYIGKAPEYYEEMSNLAEALDIGIRAIDNAPTVEPEKVLVANVTFDKDELEQLVQDRVIEPIKNGELVLQTDTRPQGKWIFVSRNCWKCPCCQELTNEGKNFCPNCGADMREESE